MRLWNVLAVMLVTGNLVAIWAQRPPTELHLTIIEGEGYHQQFATTHKPRADSPGNGSKPPAGGRRVSTADAKDILELKKALVKRLVPKTAEIRRRHSCQVAGVAAVMGSENVTGCL